MPLTSGKISHGPMAQRNLSVYRHLSGGARVTFGNEEIVLSPDDAIAFAKSIFTVLDYDVDVHDFPKLLRA